jgi:hypothetical protein
MRRKYIETYRDARDFSLRVSKSECIHVIGTCLGVDRQVAEAICRQLSLNPDDTKKCFAEGVWLHPLIELDEADLMMVVPSIASGSKLRFTERTLSEVFGPDVSKSERLGANFERNARETIGAALAENKIISDFSCLPHAFDMVAEGGEEIDLLFRIGNTVVVGELKCLLAPSESIERYNHLNKLEEAAAQVKRKAAWLADNVRLIEAPLGISGGSEGLSLVPVVILNQRVGSGMTIGDVIITDIFLVRLFVGGGSYSSGAALTEGKKAVTFTTFYTTHAEAEAALPAVLSSPPPLKPFLEGADWSKVEFPVASGRIWIEAPKLKENSLATPDLDAAANLLSTSPNAGREA